MTTDDTKDLAEAIRLLAAAVRMLATQANDADAYSNGVRANEIARRVQARQGGAA